MVLGTSQQCEAHNCSAPYAQEIGDPRKSSAPLWNVHVRRIDIRTTPCAPHARKSIGDMTVAGTLDFGVLDSRRDRSHCKSPAHAGGSGIQPNTTKQHPGAFPYSGGRASGASPRPRETERWTRAEPHPTHPCLGSQAACTLEQLLARTSECHCLLSGYPSVCCVYGVALAPNSKNPARKQRTGCVDATRYPIARPSPLRRRRKSPRSSAPCAHPPAA